MGHLPRAKMTLREGPPFDPLSLRLNPTFVNDLFYLAFRVQGLRIGKPG
jgi:hypothetical protein